MQRMHILEMSYYEGHQRVLYVADSGIQYAAYCKTGKLNYTY
jgi:hypothetical protein